MSRWSTSATTGRCRGWPTTPWSRSRAPWTATAPIPSRSGTLPPDMSGLVAHCKAYERLAVEAARSGSRETMIRALVANPLVGQYPLAEQLADALLEANRHFLPRFFPEG